MKNPSSVPSRAACAAVSAASSGVNAAIWFTLMAFAVPSLPKSTEPFTVTVVYSLKNGQVPFVKSRTFTFTAMSDSEYDNYVFLSSKKNTPGSASNGGGKTQLTPQTGAPIAVSAITLLAGAAMLPIAGKKKKK